MKAPAIMVALGKSKSEDDDESEKDATAAAQLILDAIKADDAEALSEALEAHYSVCGG